MRKTFAAVGQVGSPPLTGGGGGGGYSPEYQAVYDQFTVAPSSADATAQDTFVTSLVSAGVWSELDRLFVLASHAAGADAMLDWVHPSGTSATLVNAPTFTQYQGYVGDSLTKYINSNFDVGGTHDNWVGNVETQTGSMGCYLRTQDTADVWDIGSGSYVNLTPHYFGKAYNGLFSVANLTYDNTATQGLWAGDGSGSATTDLRLYKNGVELADLIATDRQVTGTMIFLARGGAASPSGFTSRQMSLGFMGKALGATKQLALYNAFQTLMTYYGTQV